MVSKLIRVYADTSVYGGAFDEEFARASKAFFEQVREGRFQLVVSPVIEEEITVAPLEVRRLFAEIDKLAELAELPSEALVLQEAYLRAGIVGPASLTDALHVSLATVLACRVIVSWNFRHIVNFQKIPLYNGVNKSRGYAEIAIHSPQEVIERED